MSLIYDGILSREIMDYCERLTREFHYALEIEKDPDDYLIQSLTQRDIRYQRENRYSDHGVETVSSTGPYYRIVKKNSRHADINEQFIFLFDYRDYKIARAHLRDILINDKPFRTCS